MPLLPTLIRVAALTTNNRGSDKIITVKLLGTREIDFSVVAQEAFHLDKSALTPLIKEVLKIIYSNSQIRIKVESQARKN